MNVRKELIAKRPKFGKLLRKRLYLHHSPVPNYESLISKSNPIGGHRHVTKAGSKTDQFRGRSGHVTAIFARGLRHKGREGEGMCH